ncbi:Sb-PDE family phosphodiesterase [Croceitalea vernalis]|uniref:Sb-PDE family phosphodiesterase n=1 Tax=Croceitalea vernalis TaxID=3075599 RepID=A0ABU3BJH9_9FLAO|nr:Sb-PDE family phosphodiesterase [Croceitalea sp. P007]MDT0622308.1 Sb-PDE family phosphodiesterase [Croceitalea sp. P007]
MKNLFFISALLCFFNSQSQEHSHKSTRALSFPDISGYVTLKTDLHQHTVFSDGNVWPTIRVQEALRDNLDVISLTEHIEYQPHLADIPHPDRNRSYQIALEEAKNHDLMLIHGTEITRRAPAGHSNAIFISDVNSLMQKDSVAQFAAAKSQGAFVFWNHPAWYAQQPQGNPILSNFQKERIANKELHGIEVINTTDYSEEALAIALENDLTIMGTSDIHGLIDWDYIEKGYTRPVTLVFSKERTKASLKEALFEGRTVAVFNELIVGKSEYVKPLLKACIKIENATYISNTEILKIELKNISSNNILFENTMDYTFYSSSPVFEIKGGETKTLQVKTLKKLTSLNLQLKAISAYDAPKSHPIINWFISLD